MTETTSAENDRQRWREHRAFSDFTWKNCTHDVAPIPAGLVCGECALDFRRTLIATALAEVERLRALMTCMVCDAPATCKGSYEDVMTEAGFACDKCCAHGNEDGNCQPIAPPKEPPIAP